ELDVALTGPAPVPKPELALLMAKGFSTDPIDRPAPEEPMVVSRHRRWAARLAGLGVAAKVGLGLGVAAAAVGSGGAAGVLPDPVQHVVASAVDTVSPFEFPDTANDHANFGATVSGDATGTTDGTPGVDGQAVSDAARAKDA